MEDENGLFDLKKRNGLRQEGWRWIGGPMMMAFRAECCTKLQSFWKGCFMRSEETSLLFTLDVIIDTISES